jgi:hypothetical protein
MDSAAEFADVSALVLDATLDGVRTFVARQEQPVRNELSKRLEPYLRRQIHRDPPRNIALSVAFDLGVRDVPSLTDLSLATVFGGLHTLILDDIVDNFGKSSTREGLDLYIAHLFFVIGYDYLQRLHPQSWIKSGRTTFTAAQVRTYSALIEEERNHVGVSQSYPTAAIVWEKCAPLKPLIERVTHLVGRNDLLPVLFEATDQACFGLCTLDDLLDWEEDFDRQRLTYPIQCAIDELGLEWTPDSNDGFKTALSVELNIGPTYHRMMKETLTAFEVAIGATTGIAARLDNFLRTCVEVTESGWRTHVEFLLAEMERHAARLDG